MSSPRKIRFTLPDANVLHNGDVTTYLYMPAGYCPFTLTGLIIPDDVAPHFLITNIAVGLSGQQISTGAIPASLFAASAKHKDLAMEPVTSTKMFKVSATNISDKARTFRVEVKGLPWIEGDPKVPGRLLYVVGFGNTTVPGNSSANINVQPQISIMPECLHVPPHVLKHFNIDAVFIDRLDGRGTRSVIHDQFLTRDKHESDRVICFGPDPVAPTDKFITISVTNISAQAQNFQAAILGSQTLGSQTLGREVTP